MVEFIIAMALFSLIVVAWAMLPGTGVAAMTVEETSPVWTGTETVAVVKA